MLILAIFTSLIQAPASERDWQGPRLKAVLEDLSGFVRQVDEGTRTLARATGYEGQPQGMLDEIRALITEYPALIPHAAAHVRAADVPFMSRYLALLAMSVPSTNELAEFLGAFLSAPSDPKLVFALFSQSTSGSPWIFEFAGIQYANPAKGWKMDESRFVAGFCNPVHWNLVCTGPHARPILEGLLTLAERHDQDASRPWALMLIQNMAHMTKLTERQVARLEDLYRWVLKEGRPGWGWAIQHFLERHEVEPDYETIAAGLLKLESHEQVYVLERVARRDPARLFTVPFRRHLEPAVRWLSRPMKDADLVYSIHPHLTVALVRESAKDAEVAGWLKDPTPTLKKRMSQARKEVP